MKQDGISKFEVFKESLKTAKKYLPDYPVIVFHEDYSDTDIEECDKVMYDCDKVMYDCDTDIGKELKFIKVDFENEIIELENMIDAYLDFARNDREEQMVDASLFKLLQQAAKSSDPDGKKIHISIPEKNPLEN